MIDGWLVIPNWSKWQSRPDRHDPWIKSYTDQLDRAEYLRLSPTERGLLHDLRLLFSRTNGQLPQDIARNLVGRYTRDSHWESLVQAGYLVISAAKPPPISGGSAARAREEKEKERDTPYPAERGNIENENGTPRERGENPRALGTNPRAIAKATLPERNARRWIANGLAAEIPDAHLEEVIADEFDIREPELIAELAAAARAKR